jgi:hypothetical protein
MHPEPDHKRTVEEHDSRSRYAPAKTPENVCPHCACSALTGRAGARFRFACPRCGLIYELTAAAYRRATSLPSALIARIRIENSQGRTPCISTPDLESFADGRLSERLAAPTAVRRAGSKPQHTGAARAI